MRIVLSAFLTSVALTGSVFAADIRFGDLEISKPTIRATPPAAKVGAGYLAIKNTGSTDDTLTGASTEAAMMSHLHSMTMTDGVMKMEMIADGIKLPAGETVLVKPSGNHIMFMQLKQPFEAGKTQTVTLTFEKAGAVDVEFDIKSIGETLQLFKQ